MASSNPAPAQNKNKSTTRAVLSNLCSEAGRKNGKARKHLNWAPMSQRVRYMSD